LFFPVSWSGPRGVDAVGNLLRLALVSLGYGVRRKVLAEDAAQTLRAVVQVLAERLEVAAFMRRLGEEVSGAVLVQLEVRACGFQRPRSERTIWMAPTFILKVH